MNSRAEVNAIAFAAEHWIDICAVDDVMEYLGVAARIGPQQIALFRLGNHVHALGNFDPFSGANVIARGIVGDIGNAPVVASPVYKQHFRLADGVCLEDPSVQLPVWSTRCVNGRIEILISAVTGAS